MEESCQSEPIQAVTTGDDANDARMVALQVQGMGCVNCGARVRGSLLARDGIVSADVDWERGIALVDYVPAKTSIDTIICAVTGASDDERHTYRAQVMG